MADEYEPEDDEERHEFIDGMLEDADQYEGSITNPVYKTSVGTTLKQFEPSMTEYFVAIGKLPGRQWEKPDRDDRISNEKEYRQAVEAAGLEVPEIVGEYQEYLEVETIDGDPLPEYLNKTSTEDAQAIGRRLGESLHNLHENGYAIVDLRANNIIVSDDGPLVSIDHEYATDDATDWEKDMDLITLISSARQTENDSYGAFRDGFEEGYGDYISATADILASSTSAIHAAALEHSPTRFGRGIYNSATDLSSRMIDGLDSKLEGYIER
jgi:tRNA A-37 threonylcarbamoyl transferase component Bud32